MDPDSAARILDLAEPRGSRSTAVAGFALILALAAHGALIGGFPEVAEHAAMSPATARTSPMESEHMKRLMAIGAAAAMASGAAAQDAVQWRVEDGGNGHWYGVSRVASALTWEESMALASQLGGSLATIHSETENQLVIALVVPALSIGEFGPWLGARRQAGESST
ncbi:MAG: C-type lectin domain-containing protein, partial [Phycisphaerales bacterium]